jgi:hypothetical protein
MAKHGARQSKAAKDKDLADKISRLAAILERKAKAVGKTASEYFAGIHFGQYPKIDPAELDAEPSKKRGRKV